MSARDLPDARGHFDRFGGRFVPEALQAALSQLTGTFEAAVTDPDFLTELEDLRREYAGRPSPLTEAPRFSQYIFQQTGHQVRVLLKREDLNHTGSHKINNVLGQASSFVLGNGHPGPPSGYGSILPVPVRNAASVQGVGGPVFNEARAD